MKKNKDPESLMKKNKNPKSLVDETSSPQLAKDKYDYFAWCTTIAVCCVSSVFFLALLSLIVALTVLKPYNPTMMLVSVQVDGVLPTVSYGKDGILSVNITLDLDVLVHNPNRAPFEHSEGDTKVYYRGRKVGDIDVAKGRIPSKGSEHVTGKVMVQGAKFKGLLDDLLKDLLKGEIGFNMSAKMFGKVVLLGFITRQVVAVSNCRVTIRLSDLYVERHCR